MPDKIQIPDWLHEGATVYQARGGGRGYVPVSVTRFTSTQVLVSNGNHEIRYRLSDLRGVGVDYYKSSWLVGPNSPEVRAWLEREKVRQTLIRLRNAVPPSVDINISAQLGNREKALAFVAEIRDAAQRAIDDLLEDRMVWASVASEEPTGGPGHD
jgi:hypothetical protein